MFDFDVRLDDGTYHRWSGKDGPDACRRYADAHPGVTVVAWRWPKYEIRIGMIQIEN